MKEKLLLLAMAYPEISKKYRSSLCMAGVTSEGDFRRIYPVPFEFFAGTGAFHKKQWIEYELIEKGDYRKESYKIDHQTVKPSGLKLFDTEINSLCAARVTTIEELKQQFQIDKTSIGIIKPHIQKIITKQKEEDVKTRLQKAQERLNGKRVPIELLKYDISYKFTCGHPSCKGHECKCLDIECGQLQRKLLKQDITDEQFHDKIKKQFLDNILPKDVYFVMGTLAHHPNTWTIIAILYLKPSEAKGAYVKQQTLTGYQQIEHSEADISSSLLSFPP